MTSRGTLGRSIAAVRGTWTGLDRALLALLLLAYIPGTPGLGVDTRDPGDSGVVLGTAYGIAFLLPLVAIAASWKWPRLATWCALFGGALAMLLPVLDLASILGPPPPVAVVILDLIQIALGIVIVSRRWTRRRVVAAA